MNHCNADMVADIRACHLQEKSFRGPASCLSSMPVTVSGHQFMTHVDELLALNGLQNLDSNHVEVRDLLTSFLPFLWSSPAVSAKSSHDFVSLLNCMRNMKSEHVEVRSYLAFLCFRLQGAEGDFSIGNVVSLIIKNLKGLDCEHEEVRDFLEILTLQIWKSSSRLQETAASSEGSQCPAPCAGRGERDSILDSIATLDQTPLLHQSCLEVRNLRDTLFRLAGVTE
jgi:hypothetical protein